MLYSNIQSITTEIFRSAVIARREAIEKEQPNAFDILTKHLEHMADKAYAVDDLPTFQGYINAVTFEYEEEYDRLKAKPKSLILRYFREGISRGYYWKFQRLLREYIQTSHKNVNTYAMLNHLVAAFGRYVYLNIMQDDYTTLEKTVQEIKNARDSFQSLDYDIRDEHEKINVESRIKVQDLQRDLKMLLEAANYWTIFLYNSEKIQDKQFHEFQNILKLERFDFKEALEHNLLFKNYSFNRDKQWDEWDNEKRPSGISYSPPNPSNWATTGFLLHLIKQGGFYYTIEKTDPESVQTQEYIFNDYIERLDRIKEKGYEKLASFVGANSKKQFDNKIDNIVRSLNNLRRDNDLLKAKKIADAPLDPETIKTFKELIVSGWSKGNDIKELFEYFKKIELTENKEGLFKVGHENNMFLSYKNIFIKDDTFNIPVVGLDKLGTELADSVENLFVASIRDKENTTLCENPIEAVEKGIDSLRQEGKNPSVILLHLNTWYSHFSMLNHPDFEMDWGAKNGFPLSGYGGVFKGIPIVQLRSPLIQNSICVADFAQSFSLELYHNEQWELGYLNVDVKEITNEIAESILEERKEKWIQQFSPERRDVEEVKIHLRNSVLVDYYLIDKIKVVDADAYKLMYFQ